MFTNGKISVQQMAILVIFSVIGDSILILPSITATAAKQDGWICALLGLSIGLLIMSLFFYVSTLYPDLTVIQYARLLLGSWVGTFVSIILLIHYLLNTSAMIREIGDFMTTQLLPNTPLKAVILLLILILIWGVHNGIETIGRAAEIVFPWFVLSFVLLIVFLVPKFHSINLMPVLAEGIKPVINGTLYVAMYPYAELCFFLMVLPSVKRSSHMRRDWLIASVLGGVAILTIVLACLLVLGDYLTSHQMYPAYALAKKISIGHFLERIEAIQAVIWMLSGFFKSVLYSYSFSLGTAQLFKLKDQHVVTWPMLFLLFGISYEIAPNIAYYNQTLLKYWPFWDLTIAVIIPVVLILVHKLRNKSSEKLTIT
ncbi:spore germination protein KB [Paenibacillus sp. 1_12]|uniref:GerAB/ArcD/ProY family transporter n=1 Tax=Paenibacillus sp. 1_12 TaxID=1566278 RepID=UPI0008E1D99A|nr:endospore germination permease [Paenibacillus sp. 1_12]SFM08494.1 spore germination protein KB [Paenibacillus sp. 1_12]